MKAFEYTGRWWLATNPDSSCYGTLRCDEAGNLNLFLLGSLPQDFSRPIEPDMVVIHGEVSNSPWWKITLKDCFLTARSFLNNSRPMQKYFANRAFLGDLLSSDELTFRSADIELSGMNSWAFNWSGFVKGPDRTAIYYTPPDPIRGVIPGGNFALGSVHTLRQATHEREITERLSLNLTFDNSISESDLEVGFIGPIQDFFSFATDRPNTMTQLKVGRREGEAQTISIIGPPIFNDESAAKGIGPGKMLFSFADVSDCFPDVLNRWLRFWVDHRDVMQPYFATVYERVKYADLRFQLLLQVLSQYHSRRSQLPRTMTFADHLLDRVEAAFTANEPIHAKRLFDCHPLVMAERALESLTAEHEEVFGQLVRNEGGTGTRQFINTCLNTLESIIHPDPVGTADSSFGVDVYWLAEQVKFLVATVFMKELGFSKDKQRECLNRNEQFEYIRDTIRPQLQKANGIGERYRIFEP